MADAMVGSPLTLDGLDVMVLDGTWVRKPSLYAGARVRVAPGNLTLSTERHEVRVFECQIDLYSPDDDAAVRAQCPRGQPMDISGFLLPANFAAPLGALVDIGATQTQTVELDGVEVVLRTATLHIEEHFSIQNAP